MPTSSLAKHVSSEMALIAISTNTSHGEAGPSRIGYCATRKEHFEQANLPAKAQRNPGRRSPLR